MKQIKSIYYHNPKSSNVELMIVWLQKKGYRFISVDELHKILTQKQIITEKLVFLSFDDAWRNNLDLIPIIERYSVPITIFVPIEPVYSGNYWWEYVACSGKELMELHSNSFKEKLAQFHHQTTLCRSCMSLDDIRRISKHPLVSLQAHSIHHPILTYIDEEDLFSEIVKSKVQLEGIIGKEVRYFSYPNGSYSQRELKLVSQYYNMAFTIEQKHISVNDNLYELPRVSLTGDLLKDILKYYGIWSYIKRFMKSFNRINKQIKMS